MKKLTLNLKLLICAGIVSLILISAYNNGESEARVIKVPIYLNTAYSFKERAADLVSRMTPEEKQSQLGNTMLPIPRLGVNGYNVWGETLHGVMGDDPVYLKTVPCGKHYLANKPDTPFDVSFDYLRIVNNGL